MQRGLKPSRNHVVVTFLALEDHIPREYNNYKANIIFISYLCHKISLTIQKLIFQAELE